MGSRTPLRGTSLTRPWSTPPTSTRRAPVSPLHSSGKFTEPRKNLRNWSLYNSYFPNLHTFTRLYIPIPPSPNAKKHFCGTPFSRKLMFQDHIMCSYFLFPLSYTSLLRYRLPSLSNQRDNLLFLHATFFANWYYLSAVLQIRWQFSKFSNNAVQMFVKQIKTIVLYR